MEQGDQSAPAPAQELFDHFDQSGYRNESVSDVSGSFTTCIDACYTRPVSSMLYHCTYEQD